jgi:hypothetical protein
VNSECLLTAYYPRVHETPNLDWNAEFRNVESRFSQPLYKLISLLVQWLTESKFGISKFGIPIEIRSLMGLYFQILNTKDLITP